MASLSFEKNTHLRDVSFSSYLNPSEEAFLKQLVETSKIPNSKQKEKVYFTEKNVDDEEIGVFGAEKYFNGEINEGIIDCHRDVKNQQLNLSPSKVKIRGQTPSVHSESSWNSRSALLQSGQKNPTHNKNAKRWGKSLLSTLSCNCSCGGWNSVDVDVGNNGSVSKRNVREGVDLDQTNHFRINPWIMEDMQMKKIGVFEIESKKEDGFTFPIMNLNTGKLEVKKVSQDEEDENKRKLSDVFGPPILENRKESLSLDRKLDLFTIDINPRRGEIDFPKSSKGTFDDFESDASSDLFEIESFSTTNNSNSYLVRQSSKASSCVSPTCSAPSVASIEWSVVTASAADFSFTSDSEYPKSSFRVEENAQKTGSYGKGKEVEKRRSGILSGCKSQKAVRIAGNTYKSNEEVVSYARGQRKSGSNQIQRIDS